MFQSGKKIKTRIGFTRSAYRTGRWQAGMTYVELIVVLSIFSVMSTVTLFNYNKFQAKVDIKNLANDIALKIIEAQKSALSGKLPTQPYGANWRPSYGIYFNLSSPGNNKTFVYFTDLDSSGDTDPLFCPTPGSAECVEKINITKNNYISGITAYYQDGTPTPPLTNLSVAFTRPNSGAIIKSTYAFTSAVYYIQITVTSPSGTSANIKIFASGRAQID